MEDVLLGTGAADGWPNAWCSCSSCEEARELGIFREQTCVIVDGVLAIDLPLHAARTLERRGSRYREVRSIIVTHSHEDHFNEASFMHRLDAVNPVPIEFIAPEDVLGFARRLMAIDDVVIQVEAGQTLHSNGYEITAYAAKHDQRSGPPVIYSVESASGASLLYACDTAPLKLFSQAGAFNRRFDIVLLELTGSRTHTHHDFTTWVESIRQMQASGAIDDATQVVAVHLGHGNASPKRLDEQLRALGAHAGIDGEVLRVDV